MSHLHIIAVTVCCLAFAVRGAEPVEKPADRKALREVVEEIGVPPLRPGKDAETAPTAPAFAPERLKEFAPGGADSELRKAVRKARAAVWAVATEAGGGPADFVTEVKKLRQATGFDLSVLKNGVRAMPKEAELKKMVEDRQRQAARALTELTEIYEELVDAGNNRGKESRRWQANYDFVKARLEMQLEFLWAYQSALGQMRKELPFRDPTMHGGWVLESKADVQGDSNGKKLYKSSQKLLDSIITEYAGTPWEVLAKREKERLVGLEWKAVP